MKTLLFIIGVLIFLGTHLFIESRSNLNAQQAVQQYVLSIISFSVSVVLIIVYQVRYKMIRY